MANCVQKRHPPFLGMPWDRFLVQFQILAHRQGDGTGHHAADQPLDDGLHAHQQHDEHKGVGSAQGLGQVLHVIAVIKEQYQKATQLLTDAMPKLHELAKYLYEKETITGDEFMQILNAQDPTQE